MPVCQSAFPLNTHALMEIEEVAGSKSYLTNCSDLGLLPPSGAPSLARSLTHLHRGRVASVGPCKPAVGGALVNINILQIDVNAHHAPERQREREREAPV